VAQSGMRLFLRQILEFSFFHADPHPGNILVLPDGRIGIVDFGMVGRLDKNADENLSYLIISILEQDYDRMLTALRELGFQFEDVKSGQLRMELRELVETYYGLPLKRIGLSDVIMKLVETVIKNDVKVPPNFLLLSRAMVVAEGIGRQLDPSIDVVSIGQPMIMEIVRRKSDPRKIINETGIALHELRRFMNVLPSHLETVFSRLIKGHLRVEFSHVNLEPLNREFERMGNRVAFSIVAAALILGSSLVILSGKGPYIFGLPALGIAGYVLAGIAAFWLFVSIMRSGRF